MTAAVNKSSDMEVYRVRAGHKGLEWATICIKGWQGKGNDGQPREIGEILIYSSFGCWAYQWGHLGAPFKKWLTETDDRSYIAEKFLGAKARVFDGEKTVRDLRARLIEKRRHDSLTKTEAREIWDYIDDNELQLETGERDFVEGMLEAQTEVVLTDGARRFLSEPWEYRATTMNRQFASFWREIMPVFQQALRDELIVEAKPLQVIDMRRPL